MGVKRAGSRRSLAARRTRSVSWHEGQFVACRIKRIQGKQGKKFNKGLQAFDGITQKYSLIVCNVKLTANKRKRKSLPLYHDVLANDRAADIACGDLRQARTTS